MVQINSLPFVYGFYGDADRKFYRLYCTNLHQVWLERMDWAQIAARAHGLGMDNFDHDTLAELVRNSALLLAQGLATWVQKEDQVRVDLEGLEWYFDLVPASAAEQAAVLTMLNRQQFVNHHFLLYKIQELEGLLDAKDKYIKYLAGNLESLDEGKSTEWYGKTHGPRAIQEYDKQTADRRAETSYLGRLRGKIDSVSQFVWGCVEVCLRDGAWSVSSAVGPSDGATQEKMGLRLGLQIKLESSQLGPLSSQFGPQSSQLAPRFGLSSQLGPLSLPVKREADSLPSRHQIKQEPTIMEYPGELLPKTGPKLETLSFLHQIPDLKLPFKRKLDLSDRESTPDSSPRKRRIGALPKRKRSRHSSTSSPVKE